MVKKCYWACCIIVALLSAAIWSGYRLNSTHSIPIGIYKVTYEPVQKGKYVMFCPPDNEIFREAKERGYLQKGHCKNNYMPLMKMVAATEGDTVSVFGDGIHINNKILPQTEPIFKDGLGRPLTPYPLTYYQLKSDELFLVGNFVPNSWDSRYYGIITKEQVESVVKPILVEENHG
jgi:conjugative transfer signal peptidase TraF